ncbi:MAG TPA: PH domain-containing protein [Clostridiaceae bacterium]|nr:PH domain-containing protein [Clostridiaceae bacterium]
MQRYLPRRGTGAINMFLLILASNAALLALIFLVDSYMISILLKATLVAADLHQFYYLFMRLTLSYVIEDEKLKIISFLGLRKVVLPLDRIKGYTKFSGNIRGVRLSGYGSSDSVIGRAVIDNIGTTYMYVTSSRDIIYLKTDDINYGLSPKDAAGFAGALDSRGINEINMDYKPSESVRLYKDKVFTVIFSASAFVIICMIINPIVLYLTDQLPAIMPLSFNAAYKPVQFGTGKQFAVSQMMYGFLNMAVLLCMYYASHFISKYDRKSAYKFICVPLVVSIIFFAMQLQTFFGFR